MLQENGKSLRAAVRNCEETTALYVMRFLFVKPHIQAECIISLHLNIWISTLFEAKRDYRQLKMKILGETYSFSFNFLEVLEIVSMLFTVYYGPGNKWHKEHFSMISLLHVPIPTLLMESGRNVYPTEVSTHFHVNIRFLCTEV